MASFVVIVTVPIHSRRLKYGPHQSSSWVKAIVQARPSGQT